MRNDVWCCEFGFLFVIFYFFYWFIYDFCIGMFLIIWVLRSFLYSFLYFYILYFFCFLLYIYLFFKLNNLFRLFFFFRFFFMIRYRMFILIVILNDGVKIFKIGFGFGEFFLVFGVRGIMRCIICWFFIVCYCYVGIIYYVKECVEYFVLVLKIGYIYIDCV